MPKRVVILLLALSLVLAACQPAANRGIDVSKATTIPKTALSPTAPSKPVNTLAPTLASAVTPADASGAASGTAVPAKCTVVSRADKADATQESLFPPVTEADWIEGPASARVTIIEYSDFQ